MSFGRRPGWAGLLLLGLLAQPLEAGERKEFPLKYRLTAQVAEELGAGGQELTLTARRPPLKQEPAYRSPHPLYAHVKVGINEEQIPLALDQSQGGERGYDTLYVDAGRNGRLTSREKYAGVSRAGGTVFGPVKLLVDGGGERSPQWFWFQLAEFESAEGKWVRTLRAVNAGYYRGLVAFGDQKRLLAVVDADGNGLFNDTMTRANQGGDRLLIDWNGDGRFDVGHQSEEAQPLGRYLLVGERYWHLDVAPDGSSVTVEPLDKPLGLLEADVSDFSIFLNGEEGVVRVRGRGGRARVPAGKYRLVQCSFRLQDRAGRCWAFAARYGADEFVEVRAGGAAHLRLGPPLVPAVEVGPLLKGKVNFTLGLRGAGGEVYTEVRFDANERPAAPRARVLDAATGRELALLDFHYG